MTQRQFKTGINRSKTQDARAKLTQGNRKKRRAVTVAKKRQPKFGNVRTGGFVGMNKKFVDSANTGTALTAPTDASGGEIDATYIVVAEVMGQLVGVGAGAGENLRVGSDITLLSLQIKGVVTCVAQTDQTAGDPPTHVFLAVVLDTQTNGAQLNSEDVFQNTSGVAVLAASPVRDMEHSKRFKVLKTWEMVFDHNTMTYDGTNIETNGMLQTFDCYIPLDIRQQYITNTNSQAVASVSDNSLHLIGYCSSTTLAPTVAYNCRARFVDA